MNNQLQDLLQRRKTYERRLLYNWQKYYNRKVKTPLPQTLTHTLTHTHMRAHTHTGAHTHTHAHTHSHSIKLK
jgi:hypothetical protein